jgi:hypothetical protein
MPSGCITGTPSIDPLHIQTSEPFRTKEGNTYILYLFRGYRSLCHVPFRGLIRAGRYNRC